MLLLERPLLWLRTKRFGEERCLAVSFCLIIKFCSFVHIVVVKTESNFLNPLRLYFDWNPARHTSNWVYSFFCCFHFLRWQHADHFLMTISYLRTMTKWWSRSLFPPRAPCRTWTAPKKSSIRSKSGSPRWKKKTRSWGRLSMRWVDVGSSFETCGQKISFATNLVKITNWIRFERYLKMNLLRGSRK